jgi:phage repressor protein C with HTH and peptisase S24 domain
MSIGGRIKQLRELLGLTQTEFASRIGLTYKMLGLYERGKYEPSEKILKLISSTFGVSYEWLKEGKGEMWERREKTLLAELEAKTREVLEKLVCIPVVGCAGAGFPESPADMDVVGWVLVSKETFQKGGKFSVQVHGDSMEPTLHDGDYVVFKPYVGEGSDIPNGKVVVVRNIGGELVVKRLMRINGLIVLTSDNLKYPPIPLKKVQDEELQIVGIAVEAIKRVEL